MVSLWISASSTALLIMSHVNPTSSPTVAVCFTSSLCSRFQTAPSILPSSSELGKFCCIVRDLDTFFGLIFISAQLKCFALIVQNISLPPPLLSFRYD